jgi:hypothetical protein
MEINEHESIIRFFRPSLPDYLNHMSIRNLRFKESRIDIMIVRTGDNVSISSNKEVRLEIFY